MEDLTTHLIGLERSLHDPIFRADSSAVADLLSSAFFEFGASGRVWTREAIIAALAAQPPAASTSEDFRCQVLSPDLALLTYVSIDISSGSRSLRSSLWRLEGRVWRMLFHQGTPIPLAADNFC